MKYKLIIFIIISLLILPIFSTHTIGLTENESNVDIININEKNKIDEKVPIQCQTYGFVNDGSKQSIISYDIIKDFFDKLNIYAVLQNKKPNSMEAEQLYNEIFDLIIKNDFLPDGISKDDLPFKNKFLTNHLPFSKYNKKFTNDLASVGLCNFLTFGEGSQTPIIILPRLIPVLLLPIPRVLMRWTATDAITSCGGLISEKGFIAYGEQTGTALGFWGVGFNVFIPPVKQFGFIGYALSVSCNADEFEYFPPNNVPIISNPDPEHNKKNVPISLSEISFDISDEDNDRMSYQVITEPDIGQGSGLSKNDGTYSIPISNLIMNTEYTWTVTVDDGQDSCSSTFIFTTEKENPDVLNPDPSDYSTAKISLSQLKFELFDAQNDLMDYTIETNPHIGSTSAFQVSNGIITMPVYDLQKDTWYQWYVNVTDGTYKTNKHFSFYTGEMGMVGYWNFNEGSGNTAHDISIYNNHGDVKGAQWTIGIKDNALSFDGSKDSVRVNDGDALNFDDTNAFSLSVWIKWDGETSPRNQGIIQNMFNDKGYKIILNKDGEISFRVGAGSNEQAIDVKINPNQWYYITAVWDGINQYLYLNTDLVNHSTLSNFRISAENYKDLEFGNNFAYSDDKNTFNGIIDEIRIYERVLSLSEIISLYENP